VRPWLAALLALAAPLGAQGPVPEPTWQQREADATARVERVRSTLEASGFRGVYALSQNGQRLGGGVIGDGMPFEAVFPLTSLTRQVLAVMAMQQVEAGRLTLGARASRYLPALGAGGSTVRQLLSGGSDAQIAALVERVARRPVAQLYAERVAGPTGMGALFQADGGDTRADANWSGGPTLAERAILLGQLVGTAEDVLAFDAGLLDGRLLGPERRAELMRVLSAQRSVGCKGLAVDRAGSAGRFRARNVILPGQATAMVLLTARSDTAPVPLAALCASMGAA